MNMEYRKLGRTGLDVSAIGLGTEHLEQSRETIESAIRIAVEAGVSYIDVLFGEPRNAPDFWSNFAPAIAPYRDKLVLAVHWGTFDHDMEKSLGHFEDVLDRLGNGYAEVAIIQVIDSKKQWDGWGQESVKRLLRYKEQGRIGHIGMSGHTIPTAIRAVKSGSIDVLMFPINMIEHKDEDIRPLYRTCADNNVGIVAMKPYKGGTLLFASGKPSGIRPSQCLSYVLAMPVSTTVPGPKNIDELQKTLDYLKATHEEKDYSPVIAGVYDRLKGQCVYCNHCLPCPQNIEIGWSIWCADQARGGVTDNLLKVYSDFKAKASECTKCGVCIERCPFDVDIITRLQQAVEIFEGRSEEL